MRLRLLLSLGAILVSAVGAAPPQPRPVEVMILGTYHMSNPGRDLHNMRADDVLAPKRQSELEAIASGLARFRPTKVMVEWDPPVVAERYPKYVAGTLPPSRNEVVQLGFRVAKKSGASIFGIDVDGDFPFEPVKAYADSHGIAGLLAAGDARTEAMNRTLESRLATTGVQGALRYINDPARLGSDHDWYRTVLRIGGGKDQPGADLLTAWYRRNFLICANILQLSKPGDHVVVIYGFGHAFLLRQCVTETPGLKLVEPNFYLPR
jgi:hypothetical protein